MARTTWRQGLHDAICALANRRIHNGATHSPVGILSNADGFFFLAPFVRRENSLPAAFHEPVAARALLPRSSALLAAKPLQNHLLAALPAEAFNRLAPHLELVPMLLGAVLCESGASIQHVYFPTTSIVSLQYVMESGATSEIAGVGNEGMVGISAFMGGVTTPSRALVQTGGVGYRLASKILVDESHRDGPIQRLLLRYTQALITQIAQTGACTRSHSMIQQLCRWLLLTLDRMPTNDLVMTQELIASMLGVRRESVTEAVGSLKKMGVISCRRGHITILDRTGLNLHVCECYAVVKGEFGRLLPQYSASPMTNS